MFEITNPRGAVTLDLESFPLRLMKSHTVTLSRSLSAGSGGWNTFIATSSRMLFIRPLNTSTCSLTRAWVNPHKVMLRSTVRGTIVDVYEFDDEVLTANEAYGIAIYNAHGDLTFNTASFTMSFKAAVAPNASTNIGAGAAPAFCYPNNYHFDEQAWGQWLPEPVPIGPLPAGSVNGGNFNSTGLAITGGLYQPGSFYAVNIPTDWLQASTCLVIDVNNLPIPFGD